MGYNIVVDNTDLSSFV